MNVKIILLLLLPLFSHAQKKGDTKIIVRLADTTSILTRLATHLYERGYLIEEKDEVLRFIETKPVSIKNSTSAYKITAQLEGGIILFSTLLSTDPKNKTFIDVEYGAAKSSANAKAWQATEEIARELGHNISYQ